MVCRFPNGESGADVYDRMTIFEDHLVRDINAGKQKLRAFGELAAATARPTSGRAVSRVTGSVSFEPQ